MTVVTGGVSGAVSTAGGATEVCAGGRIEVRTPGRLDGGTAGGLVVDVRKGAVGESVESVSSASRNGAGVGGVTVTAGIAGSDVAAGGGGTGWGRTSSGACN